MKKFTKIIKESTDQELMDRFDDYVDSIYEPYRLFEITLNPSYILKKCDPIAYRCYFVDWKNEEGFDEDDEEVISDSVEDKNFTEYIWSSDDEYDIYVCKKGNNYFVQEGEAGDAELIPVEDKNEAEGFGEELAYLMSQGKDFYSALYKLKQNLDPEYIDDVEEAAPADADADTDMPEDNDNVISDHIDYKALRNSIMNDLNTPTANESFEVKDFKSIILETKKHLKKASKKTK